MTVSPAAPGARRLAAAAGPPAADDVLPGPEALRLRTLGAFLRGKQVGLVEEHVQGFTVPTPQRLGEVGREADHFPFAHAE